VAVVAAVTWALVSIAGLLALMLTSTGVWLHAEISEGKLLRDSLDQEQRLSFEYQHERDVMVAKLKVAEDLLAQEKNLRVIAESQRNAAQQKARAYLAQHLVTASENEITDVVQELFSTPLSVVGDSALMRTDE
jgi:CRISPR/Cas system CMR subunit Cmr4 (Cas7 group RAMP superfamily)